MIIIRFNLVILLLLSITFHETQTNAQTQSLGLDNDPIFPINPNRWYISTDTLRFTALIEEVAPILWFSPHEEFKPRKFPLPSVQQAIRLSIMLHHSVAKILPTARNSL